jgi:hypothetical protein
LQNGGGTPGFFLAIRALTLPTAGPVSRGNSALALKKLPMLCDLARGPVLIAGSLIQCNGSTGPIVLPVTVTGQTATNRIQIRNSAISLQLRGVSIAADLPFSAVQSSVSLILEGANELVSTQSAALSCSDGTNITVAANGRPRSARREVLSVPLRILSALQLLSLALLSLPTAGIRAPGSAVPNPLASAA